MECFDKIPTSPWKLRVFSQSWRIKCQMNSDMESILHIIKRPVGIMGLRGNAIEI